MAAAPSRRLPVALILLLAAAAPGFAQTINASSPDDPVLWAVGTFGSAQLTGAPGTDFTATHTTAANWVDIDITLSQANKNWRVDVGKADTTWNANLHLYIQRTADGTGDGHPLASIAGGTTYQEITTTASFFTGRRRRTDVKAQLQGLSVIVGPANFSTTVTLTVTET